MDFREVIIMVAGDLFLQKGVKDVTMDVIAQKLKVSKRTIYFYFKDKDALIKAAGEKVIKEQNVLNNKIIQESENSISAILALLRSGSELLSTTNPKYYTDLQRLYPCIWRENIQQSKIHSYKLILDLLKQGKNEGNYRNEIKEEIIACIFIEQLYMITDQRIFPPGKFSIVEVYENIIINMTRGIATSKGLKLIETLTEVHYSKFNSSGN
jgi:TetR/AcrR family transcriptional regulator, cholesterol catabolism regulator